MNGSKLSLVVVSPFVDKRHGTERGVAEWLDRLVDTFDVHLYSQRVEDLDLSRITWHRIPKLPGPHLFNYLWWFAANHFWRSYDWRFRGLRPDLVFSPGINCFDADAISVHVVFAEYLHEQGSSLRLLGHSIAHWPRLLHRKTYYALIARLERHIYCNPKTSLIPVSRRVSTTLGECHGRKEAFPVVYAGIDHDLFNPRVRMSLRAVARTELGLDDSHIALLLVGNDWRNKGLPVLLDALGKLRDLPLSLLVVGQDDSSPFRRMIEQNELARRVLFLPPRKDVEFYYAAADIYAGPSRAEAFGQPPAEAMACGLPVITSATCGVSEIISDELDGIVLRDPSNADDVAARIRKLCVDRDYRNLLGANAARKMAEFTWERNAREIVEILLRAAQKKKPLAARALRQEA